MKRQQAFGNDAARIDAKTMLKGGLHCHTTRSDGKGDPAEVIRLHKQNGYDFLAITDHRKYNYENFAPEVDITILPGMQYNNQGMPFEYGSRQFHTVCVGPAKADGNGYDQDEVVPAGTAKDQFEYQAYLDEIHAKNNLTIYCHPGWSCTPARFFDQMEGNFAMEIWNSTCALTWNIDSDAAYWDEILGQGKRIFGVASDDGHGMHAHCNGWVRVNAENNINAILAALKDGAFYASCGPEIYDFHVDGDKVVIECSEAATIVLYSDGHVPRFVRAKVGESLTRAEFDAADKRGPYRYWRITVTDKNGKRAWTNPIFND